MPPSLLTHPPPALSAPLPAPQAVPDPIFKQRLPELFPVLALLIRADYAPHDVHRALSELMVQVRNECLCVGGG